MVCITDSDLHRSSSDASGRYHLGIYHRNHMSGLCWKDWCLYDRHSNFRNELATVEHRWIVDELQRVSCLISSRKFDPDNLF